MTNDWDGVDRRKAPDPDNLKAEIRATRQDLGRLATAVTALGSDEKLQAAIDSVAQEQRRHWQRTLAPLIAALLVIAGVTAVGASWANDAKDASRAAGRVATYVDHCLVHPDRAKPGECGNTTATGQQSVALLAIFCYLQIDPTLRTEANARYCFEKATAQAKAAATTTTTGG